MKSSSQILEQLEKKLNELDKEHRDYCAQIMNLDEEIQLNTNRISTDKLQKSETLKHISQLQTTLHGLEKQKQQPLALMSEVANKLNEITKSEGVRLALLTEMGVSAPQQFGVKRATLESQMKTQRTQVQSIEDQVKVCQKEIDDLTLLLDPQNVEKLQQEVHQKIEETKSHKADLESVRIQVAEKLSECQHLIDDVKTRISLEHFVIARKLVASEDLAYSMPIDELVHLWNYYKPKEESVESSSDESSDSEVCDEKCTCRRPAPNKEMIEHVHAEIFRLDGGYTRAAAKEFSFKSRW